MVKNHKFFILKESLDIFFEVKTKTENLLLCRHQLFLYFNSKAYPVIMLFLLIGRNNQRIIEHTICQ